MHVEKAYEMRVKIDKEVDNVKHSNIKRYIEQVFFILIK